MTSGRRAGAPRLIEWTGERCVPWAPDVQVVYEHLHRYMWAADLVVGRRVLDLASGEGFGAAILAESAEHVTGIDIDRRTVDHSSLNYGDERIEFEVGDAADLSRFADGSFGAVVAFEMIEHIHDQGRVLEEIERVLGPDGVLIMSTPDRRAYTDATETSNPFHVHELDLEGFTALVGGAFENVATWGQRTITGSVLAALDDADDRDPPARTFFIEREGDEWRAAVGLWPLYLVAVASHAKLPAIAAHSTLADCGLALRREAEAASASAAREQLVEARSQVSRLEGELAERERAQHDLSRRVADRELEVKLDRLRIDELTVDAAQSAAALAALEAQGSQVSWRLFYAARAKAVAALGGERSIRTRLVRRTLRIAAGARRARRPPATIDLPVFPEPQVSLVIPLYSAAELTRGCLQAIRDNTSEVSYEVILVDDAADAETKALLADVRGARVVANETNLGYQESVQRGAAEARGEWLVLCNNDIQPLSGWLVSMLACAQSADDIGIVTPKYLYPDMSLNEAGGVIWRDGTGGNYGRGEDPGECRYEFRREVDYGSAAALMVRADFWREVGGFDARFAPMYYEDTDLCFQARERGLRVMFEPRANVIHVEGATAGTDVTRGPKRFQEVNRVRFVNKWQEQLDRDQLAPSEHNERRAANRARGPHVLILDHRVPMADRDSGSLRMRAMIRSLQELGCRVTFFPEDRHLVLPYTLELLSAGVEVWFGDIDVPEQLSEVGPELALVITSRPHTTSKWLDLVRECAPNAPVLYDTVDLHWLREARRAATRSGTDGVALGPRAVALREIELALIRATDATLVVSPEERAQVEADVPGAVVRVVPNVNELREDVPPAAGRRGVIFIGGFEHTPNIDAALRLVRGVMPKIWERMPDVPVKLIGGEAPPEIEALASPLVDVTGWVRDVRPLFGGAVAMLAPLSYGAGLKGKVTQALAEGLPVVTTAVGAEGLQAADGEQLLIADDDDGLAKRVIELSSDPELWARLSAAGQRLVAERCSPEVMSAALQELLEARGKLGLGARPTATRV